MHQIRDLALTDVEAVHAIHCACLERSLSGGYTPKQIKAWMSGRTPEGYWRAALGGEHFLVLEVDATVIGFSSWRDDELLSLFIHPDYHNRGYGSALLTVSMERAGLNRLNNVKAAIGAEKFYEAHGFKVVATGATLKRGVSIPDIRMSR